MTVVFSTSKIAINDGVFLKTSLQQSTRQTANCIIHKNIICVATRVFHSILSGIYTFAEAVMPEYLRYVDYDVRALSFVAFLDNFVLNVSRFSAVS